jgi:hypothetical protein
MEITANSPTGATPAPTAALILTPVNIAAAGAQAVVDQLQWAVNSRSWAREKGELGDAWSQGWLALAVRELGHPEAPALDSALAAANRVLALALQAAADDAVASAEWPLDAGSLRNRARRADEDAQRHDDQTRLSTVLNGAACGDVTVNVVGMQVGICIDGAEITSHNWQDPDFWPASDARLIAALESKVERARFILATDPDVMAQIIALEDEICHYAKRAAELRASDDAQGWDTPEEYENSLPGMYYKLDVLCGREADEHWDHEHAGDPKDTWCEFCVDWAAEELANPSVRYVSPICKHEGDCDGDFC